MSKVIQRAERPPREPEWWYRVFLRDGSVVERDGVQWRLQKSPFYSFKYWVRA